MNSFNDPLLYIKGPPVFHLPADFRRDSPSEVISLEEESTSIYEIKSTVSEKNYAMMEQLKFLSKPFQKQVYRPLTFHMEDGVLIQGEVEKIDSQMVTIKTNSSELIAYPIEQVKRVAWRGSILK